MDDSEKGVSLKDIGLEPRTTAVLPRPDDAIKEPNPKSYELVIAKSMVDDAEAIKHSPNQHERKAYNNAELLYQNINDWVYQKVLTPEQGVSLLIAAMAKGEVDGLKDVKSTLLNQAGFTERLAHQISRIHRTKESLQMMYIDLEGFKKVNDTLGHAAGDEILELTGEFIKEHIRGDDEAARLHGDEFAISGTEQQGVTTDPEESFKTRIEKIFSEKYDSYVKAELENRGIPTNITLGARIGHVTYKPGETIEDFIDRADADMNSKRDPNKPSR